MNKVILMGRLTRDPEVRYMGQGADAKCVAKFNLAVDRRVARNNGETEADFIYCQAWSKKAEFCEKYLHQGSKVVLSGRIQTGSYVTKDNQKVYTTDVVVEDIEFAESKQTSQQSPAPITAPDGHTVTPQTDDEIQDELDRLSWINKGFLNIPQGVEEEQLPFH